MPVPRRTAGRKAEPPPPKAAEKAPEPKAAVPPPEPEKPKEPPRKPFVPIKKKTGKDAIAGFENRLMQSFKDAFEVIDNNKDGIIDKRDLKDMYANVGQIASDEDIEAMLKEAPGKIDFDTFVIMFGERFNCSDPYEEIIAAFRKFDPEDTGTISVELFEKLLTNKKIEPLDEKEMGYWQRAKAPVRGGRLDYKKFARQIINQPREELSAA